VRGALPKARLRADGCGAMWSLAKDTGVATRRAMVRRRMRWAAKVTGKMDNA